MADSIDTFGSTTISPRTVHGRGSTVINLENDSGAHWAQDMAFDIGRFSSNTMLTVGTVAVAALAGPYVAAGTAAILATNYAAGRLGRNHDMRERPVLRTRGAINRLREKINYHFGKEQPAERSVWRASEQELAAVAYGERVMSAGFRSGITHSLPVKTYAYSRLAVAKVRDELNSFGRFFWYTGKKEPKMSGVSFHEGVAARRLQRAGLITPNPRTQEHIKFARNWYETNGRTLG